MIGSRGHALSELLILQMAMGRKRPIFASQPSEIRDLEVRVLLRPIGREIRMTRWKTLCVLALVAGLNQTGAWGQPDDRYTYRAADGMASPGVGVDIPIYLDIQDGALGAPEPIHGLQISVCHDPSQLELLDVVLGSTTLTINNGGPAFLSLIDQFEDGFTSGLVNSMFGDSPLGAGLNYEMYIPTYAPLGPIGSTAAIEFCNTIGSGVDNVVVADIGNGPLFRNVVTIPGLITVGQDFRRGDCNNDGGSDIADAVFLSDYLFGAGATGSATCLDACDGNDDGTVNVADIVVILGAIFGDSGPLPAPNADCGEDPTVDGLDCIVASSCP